MTVMKDPEKEQVFLRELKAKADQKHISAMQNLATILSNEVVANAYTEKLIEIVDSLQKENRELVFDSNKSSIDAKNSADKASNLATKNQIFERGISNLLSEFSRLNRTAIEKRLQQLNVR